MLLRGIISTTTTPLPSLRLKTTRNVTVSSTTQTIVNKFSISDQELESRGFILGLTISDLNISHLNSIFVSVGFPKQDPDRIKIALENTSSLLRIENRKTQRPVAFARATGDDVFNAIVWDVVVDPSFQGIGLGKAVMERLVDELLKGFVTLPFIRSPECWGFIGLQGLLQILMGSVAWFIQENRQTRNNNLLNKFIQNAFVLLFIEFRNM